MSVDGLKFLYFCKICDKVRSQKSKPKAAEILESFIDTLTQEDPPTFFPILRLLLPHLDRERGPYGIKETNLARLYKRILALAPSSVEAKALANFTSPGAMKAGAMGDFAEVLSCVLRSRCVDGGTMTILDVNECLDNIASKHAENNPRAVDDEFAGMVSKMSSFEQKWLVRIILKSMDLGLGHKKMLSIYHPDANEVYILTNSIMKVCQKLKNRSIRYYELGIELFQPFRPMLCERADIHSLTINSLNYVETKMDGERFQIHFKEGSFKYFSRNGYDYSDNYGENAEIGHFSPLIVKQFSPDMQSCILDGEMMGWHRYKKVLVTKASNIDVKQLKPGSTLQPCFCVFDIVMHNDNILTGKPLSERIKIAETAFTPLEGVFMHVQRSTIYNTQDAFNALNSAIDNNEEGIIIKDPNSMYIPNSRKSEWRKLKPDYSEGTVDLDVLIIGGYYGSGRKKGTVCHFLLGIAEESCSEPEKFMSFARASSGISDEELVELRSKLDPHWIKFKGDPPPFMLLKKEKPDVYIYPRNSVILQVKSPEVVRTDLYYTEYTLRFVRVDRIRYDKLWSECLQINEFTRLRTASAGKLTAGHIVPSTSRRKRKFDNPDKSATPAPKIEKMSDLFLGKELCVMNGNKELSKDDLEKMVRQHGGSTVQHPTSSTFCVLYADENIRVRNVIKAKKHNVTKNSWALDCIKSGRLLPWNRQNLISTDLKTSLAIAEQFDAYGDNYFEPLTLEGLKNIFETMHSVPLCTPEELEEIDTELFNSASPYSLFRNYYAYFDIDEECYQSKIKSAQIIFQFLAGTVFNTINRSTSYIIIDETNLRNISDITKQCVHLNIDCTFVSYRWIIDTFFCKTVKRVEEYCLKKPDSLD